MGAWRRTFAGGLIVLIPILICASLLVWIYLLLLQIPLLQELRPPIVRVVVLLLVFGLWVMSIGYLMRTTLGGVIDRQIDATMNRFPVVRLVHTGLKGAIETVVLRRDIDRMPIKIETWDDVYMTAFRTGNRTADGREVVFVPGAPDVTSGFVVDVKPEDVIETDETVMEALVRLMSCGFSEVRDQHDARNLRLSSDE